MIGRVFSHYRVIEKLGAGGMGVVYLAEDTLLRRKVAIKFPAVSARRRRFLAEARAASALTHPAIAAVYDCGELDDAPYIVMELVEGSGLNELLRAGPLAVGRALEIAAQVAEGLREAHSRRIIHRDIKPSNIRIDKRGAVKVVDFGLAKSLAVPVESGGNVETATMEGTICGTPQYMSPEQANGKRGDERSDIFSLGAVLYECLAGKPPFRGETTVAVLAQTLHFDPPPPSQFNRAVPPAVDAVALRMLAKDPARRFQNTAELLAALAKVRAPGRFARALAFRLPSARVLRTRKAAVIGALLAVALLGVALAEHWRVYEPGPAVLKWYQFGVAAIRDGTFYKASKALEEAVKLDARYPLAHARLAEASNELEDTSRAQEEMLKAQGSAARVSNQDELQIQAVYASVTGDFAKSAEDYRAMLPGAAAGDKPAVLVDMGRALEKELKLKDAMDAYQEAARLDANYPAAFLRMGQLAGRRQDQAASNAAFDRAAMLYETLSNVEGETEVLYQRGVQASAAGRIDEAAALLEQARRKADAAGNYHQEIAAMLQMCEVDFRRNDLVAAEQIVAAALDLARRNGLELSTARGLIYMGSAYLGRGDRRQAEKYFGEALDLARRFHARRTEARAMLSLGSLYLQQFEYDKAIQAIEQGLPYYEQGQYLKERSQGLLLLGRARRDMGDVDGAVPVFQQLLRLATDVGDSAQIALTHEDMGLAELYREHYPEALAQFEERTKEARALGNLVGVVYGLLQSANASCGLGRYPEADADIREARSIASGPGGSPLVEHDLQVAEAEVALSEDRAAEAAADARRLLGAGETLVVGARAGAEHALGSAALREGGTADAERDCGQALELARSAHLVWNIPPALICHAEALAAVGRAREGLAEAQEARADCARTGQKESEAQAWLAMARAAAASGDRAAAREDDARAGELLDALAQSLSADNRRSFETRPDVERWRKEIQSNSDGARAGRGAIPSNMKPTR